MKLYNSIFLFYCCLLSGTEKRIIDHSYAAQQVKKALFLSDPIHAEPLLSGYSRASIFKVQSSTSSKFVIRFLEHKNVYQRQSEMIGLQNASNLNYGPHIYFISPDNSYIIMEYIDHQNIPFELLKSSELCIMLAQLLSKIHKAPAFSFNSDNIFERIYSHCDILSARGANQALVPIDQIKQEIQIIEKILMPYSTPAPCHNDLHPNNLLFTGNKFMAIDFERVGQADSYVDIATIATFYCFTDQSDALLLKTYLEREPNAQETAKLLLTKQVVRLKHGLSLLLISEEPLSPYASLPNTSYVDFMAQIPDGPTVNFHETVHRVHLGKILINQAVSDIATDKFKEAVQILRK